MDYDPKILRIVDIIENAPYLFSGELELQGASTKCGPCDGKCYGPPGPACTGGCRPCKGIEGNFESDLSKEITNFLEE